MIFSRADREVLLRVEVRKACESATIGIYDSISPVRRNILASHLLMDMARCHAMIRLADNDLTNIREDMAIMDEGPATPPLDIYTEYLQKVVTPEAGDDEGQYTFLYGFMMSYIDHIRKGIQMAEDMIRGIPPVSDGDMIRFARTRDMLERMLEHCEGMDDGDGVPYSGAAEYLDCNLEECSIILRIGSGRDVSLEEISFHMEWADTQDPSAFDTVFGPDISEDEDELLSWYESIWDRRLWIMIGRAVADCDLGL